MPRLFLIAVLLCGLFACRKDDDTVDPVPAGGSWSVDAKNIKAFYSETATRSGYYIRFSDSPGANSISFLFRSRPESAGTFTPAADTSKYSNVVIRLERDGVGYHSTPISNAALNISLPERELYLEGTGLRMAPDTTAHAEMLVDLKLREF